MDEVYISIHARNIKHDTRLGHSSKKLTGVCNRRFQSMGHLGDLAPYRGSFWLFLFEKSARLRDIC